MIISHKYKFVFFATMKTASSSVGRALGDKLKTKDPDFINYKYSLLDRRINPTFSSDKKILQTKYSKHTAYHQTNEKEFKNYFKFSFVRNPWDRAVSWWFFNQNLHKDHPTRKKIKDLLNFKDFILSAPPSMWYQSQYRFTKGCDFIGRFEDLQNDFNIVCNKLGLGKIELTKRNSSKHLPYNKYYNNETRQIVAEKYAKDIEYFGYKFGK